MKHLKPILLIVFLLSFGSLSAQVKFNGGMELLSADKKQAVGWLTYFQKEQLSAYPVKVDSVVKQEGKYSLSIQKVNDDSNFGVIDFVIPKTFKGDRVELRGYLKTENVANGYAGLWLRIDGTPAFDNMQSRGVTGNTDWKEYSIELPYDSAKAINIHAGALLSGDGKLWADNFRLYINGKPIEQVTVKEIVLTKAEKDTSFSLASKIDTVLLGKQQLINLTALGQVWGFLKYHHPAVASGNINWDAELFRIMPLVIKTTDNVSLSNVIEKWVDGLGVPPVCKDCEAIGKDVVIKLKPNYGILFTNTVLSPSLTKKLTYILNNRNNRAGYYITMMPNGNPSFIHENTYSKFTYPDAGYRLLCLYRYWNMINYFYPYRYLIGEDWNNVLVNSIPKFVLAANGQDYALNTLALIGSIHDTHANIYSYNKALSNYKGKYGAPFQANFVEDRLVVTGYYDTTATLEALVKPGDIIDRINGQAVSSLIKKYLPYTPASNYATQLRDMPKAYLLRTNEPDFILDIIRDGKHQLVTVKGQPFSKIDYGIDRDPAPKAPGFYLINKDIGYLYPGKYHNKDLEAIKTMFNSTKGIIIDMRCYPSEFMPFTFGPYIKTNSAPFVKFSKGTYHFPGFFTITPAINVIPGDEYKGKIVVIVNEHSQSQAEYTTMAFQSSPNVKVIGSTTAGADGDVSPILLPGGISTMISGLGVYYPEGDETQRKGVKIDITIKPTIAGIKAGRDELLEKAKATILDK
ncbi:S41 family peptidase [Mucilaginibacter sp.]|uniref:S41 family peptidase n=1 Tax=Mucilaginibacter sp. TaxID=1882438 RepID=UPI003D0E5D23